MIVNYVFQHKDHMTNFENYARNLGVQHDDVVIRMFVQSLDEDVRKWFKTLPNDSIHTREALRTIFLNRWGDKKDDQYLIAEFSNLRKRKDGNVSDFNKIFMKLYNKLPDDIRPPSRVA